MTAFAGLAYTYWRPSFYPFEGEDCLAAKLDRFQHHLRRLGERQWPPHLLGMEAHPLGLVLAVARTHGQTVEDYRRAAPRLASALAALRVDVQPGPGADVVQLIVVIREPLIDSIPLPPSRRYRGRSAVELGVREDGKPWVMRLADSSGVLIGGVPGSGKSGVLAALLAGLAGTPGVEIAGVDLKGGVELGPWAPCMLTLATTLEEAVPVLEEGVELLQHRYKLLWAQGARHVAEIAPAPPLRVIVVDEAADVFTPAPGSKTEKELTDRALRAALSIARRGRAGQVLLVLATQKPDAVAIPTALRDQLGHRVALRTSTRQHVETIVGGLVDLAEVPWQIPPHLPGVALVAGSEPEQFLARAYEVTTEDVRRIVKQATRDQSAGA